MSRYSDVSCDDQLFPNQAAFWRANAHRALRGKRGRKALAELRDALLALPQKRLIARALCTVAPDKRREDEVPVELDGGYRFTPAVWRNESLAEIVAEEGEGVCAVGAYVWWQKVKAGADPVGAFDALPTLPDTDEGINATADAGHNAGLVWSLAWQLAYRNDETFDLSPEQRYTAFMAWIDHELDAVSA